MPEKTKVKPATPRRGYEYMMKSYRNIDPECIRIKNVMKEIIASLWKARENELRQRFKNLKAGEGLEMTIVSYLGNKFYKVEFITAQGKVCRALAHYLDRRTPQENNKRKSKKTESSGCEEAQPDFFTNQKERERHFASRHSTDSKP